MSSSTPKGNIAWHQHVVFKCSLMLSVSLSLTHTLSVSRSLSTEGELSFNTYFRFPAHMSWTGWVEWISLSGRSDGTLTLLLPVYTTLLHHLLLCWLFCGRRDLSICSRAVGTACSRFYNLTSPLGRLPYHCLSAIIDIHFLSAVGISSLWPGNPSNCTYVILLLWSSSIYSILKLSDLQYWSFFSLLLYIQCNAPMHQSKFFVGETNTEMALILIKV